MVRRLLLALVVGWLGFFCAMGPASAGAIPIPCTGEKIVRIQDLDGAPAAADGSKIGLGYLYTGCFSGRWIAHTGSDSRYIDAGDLVLTLAKGLGGDEEPREPGLAWGMWSHPGAFWVEWLWATLLTLFVGCGLRNLVLYGTFAHPSASAPTTAAVADPAPQPQSPRGFGRRASRPSA